MTVAAEGAAAGSAADRAAVRVAAAVSAHPGVARLDGGPFGTVASYLPGRRRVDGVRLSPAPGGPVEIAVVAYTGAPLPVLAEQVGGAVRSVLGDGWAGVPIVVIVSDVVPAPVGRGPRSGPGRLA